MASGRCQHYETVADSGARTSPFSHDPMVTESYWITVYDVLKE